MPRSSQMRAAARPPTTAWRTPARALAAVVALRVLPVTPVRPRFVLDPADEVMDGPDPRKLIDRRQLPRVAFAVRAALAPADDRGAVRPPAIRTRDLNRLGLGFLARQDLSVLGEAVLRLPGVAGRVVCVACRVRRSRELGNGWYDGLVEFAVPQPDLVVENGVARLPRPRRR